MPNFPFAKKFTRRITRAPPTSSHIPIHVRAVSGSKRLALIIGNSVYGENFSTLKTPSNDANAMKEKLTFLGFAIDDTLNVDRTYLEMLGDIEKFTKRIHE